MANVSNVISAQITSDLRMMQVVRAPASLWPELSNRQNKTEAVLEPGSFVTNLRACVMSWPAESWGQPRNGCMKLVNMLMQEYDATRADSACTVNVIGRKAPRCEHHLARCEPACEDQTTPNCSPLHACRG